MFYLATNANPDTSGWDTANVANMSFMFRQTTNANPDTSGWDTANVTSMNDMFFQATNADPDMSSWNFSQVSTMANMFASVTLSRVNYDNMLIQIDATSALANITLDGGNSTYTQGVSAADTARGNLITDGWTITDGGSAP
jgi:hypothetical protein